MAWITSVKNSISAWWAGPPPSSEVSVQIKGQIARLRKQYNNRDKVIQSLERQVGARAKSGDRASARKLLLEKKKLETQNEQLAGKIEGLEQRLHTLDSMETNVAIVDTTAQANEVMRTMSGALREDRVKSVLDETEEHARTNEEIDDLLSAPMGVNMPVDDQEMEDELDAYMGLNEERKIEVPDPVYKPQREPTTKFDFSKLPNPPSTPPGGPKDPPPLSTGQRRRAQLNET